MLESPFAFLRRPAMFIAADLAPTPVTAITVQAFGDMHVRRPRPRYCYLTGLR